MIFSPLGTYSYEVVGLETGMYDLDVALIEDRGISTFSARDIPIGSTVAHKFTIDWSTLTRGEEGVTVEVDSDGNGVPEYTFTSDSELTLSEFLTETAPSSLSVSISPLSASLLVGHSVTFTSTVSGGVTPYSYQWYFNSAPVSGATSGSWTFTPSVSGIYYVYLKVIDAASSTVQSDAARIAVTATPVGGYSISLQPQTTAPQIPIYLVLTAILTAMFTRLKPRIKKKR